MNMRELIINIPEGYEIDKENSTFECIKFKPIPKPKTWDNIPDNVSGYYMDYVSGVSEIKQSCLKEYNKNVFFTKAQADSALAKAQLSQIIQHYYKPVSDEDWGNISINKYCLYRSKNRIEKLVSVKIYQFLAFYNFQDREEFLETNEELIKKYFMIQ